MFEKIMGMFSIYGRPREADRSDTRQEIRRHEPEQERKKGDDKPRPQATFDIGDSANVSVDALRLFLANFLRGLEQEEATRTPGSTLEIPDIKAPDSVRVQTPQDKKIQGQNAQAASAYKHVGQATQRSSIMDAAAATGTAGLSLPASEIRTIHRLLDDLKILSDNKIELLRIERGESFLQSLVVAVDKALKS